MERWNAHGAEPVQNRIAIRLATGHDLYVFLMRSKMPQPIAADAGEDDGAEAGDRLRLDGVEQAPSLGVAFAHRERGPTVTTDSRQGVRDRRDGDRENSTGEAAERVDQVIDSHDGIRKR